MAIVINGQTGIDAGHLPISNAGNTEIEGTLTGADVTVASITANSVITQGQNVSPFSGFKNYIINGNFDVWQRGSSQTQSGYGSDDRWSNANTGSTKTHSQVVCTDTEKANFNARFYTKTIVTSVTGAGNYVSKSQAIEDVTRLAGKTVTLSFWANADSNKNIAVEFAQVFGTGGTPSSVVSGIGSQTIALTTLWKKYTITVTLPSIVGKTIGTDGVQTSSTFMSFWFDAGSDFNTRTANLGQQSGTFNITQVQLEEGSVATPFEQRPYGLELSLCQRYYQVGAGTIKKHSTSELHSGTQPLSIPLFMRVAPTMSFSNTGEITSANALNYSATKEKMNIHGGIDYNAASVGAYTFFSFNASAEL